MIAERLSEAGDYWQNHQPASFSPWPFSLLLRKLARRAIYWITTAIAVPFVILVRLLRPFVTIRFGVLLSSRIGHFAANTDLYVCEKKAGLQPRGAVDIFYYAPFICNHQLKKMWDRTLRVWPFVASLDRANRFFPGGGAHTVSLTSDRDVHGLVAKTPSHLSFTSDEESQGRRGLEKLGLTPSTPFVCFIGRDSHYLNNAFPGYDWSYHNYRDMSIQDYLPAMEELAHRGYWSIRMGARVQEALRTTNPRIIDYALKDRSDFLDIYLGAKCSFMVADTAGFYAVASLFRRPVVRVNCVPLADLIFVFGHGLAIPKKLWSREHNRFLTFRDIVGSKIFNAQQSYKFNDANVEVVNNTPSEIKDVVIEMEDRISGRWQETTQAVRLQRSFWTTMGPRSHHGIPNYPIGSTFLGCNQDWLQ